MALVSISFQSFSRGVGFCSKDRQVEFSAKGPGFVKAPVFQVKSSIGFLDGFCTR